MTIKAKKKSLDCGLLSLTCIQFEKWFEYLRKNDWILSLRYNLQRSIMLFYEAEIFSFSKNVYSIGPFPDPPIYSTIAYCMWRKNIDIGGVSVRGEQGERAKKTDELD